MAGSAVVRNLKLTHRLHGCSRVLATLDPATYGARKRVRRCRSVRWTLAAGTSGPAAPGPGPAPVVPVAGPTVSHRQPATSGSADRSSWPARSGDAQRSSARSPAAVWRAPARGACSARPSSCSSRQARYAPGDSGHAGDVGLGRVRRGRDRRVAESAAWRWQGGSRDFCRMTALSRWIDGPVLVASAIVLARGLWHALASRR